MARKKQAVIEFVMFDVFYQDGTRTSHRKVPAAEPYEQDFEARVKATIEAQDRDRRKVRPPARADQVDREVGGAVAGAFRQQANHRPTTVLVQAASASSISRLTSASLRPDFAGT